MNVLDSNTSYVIINLFYINYAKKTLTNSNTSYVIINLKMGETLYASRF